MEQINTRLGRTKGFTSINNIQNINVDFERTEKILPVNDARGRIDAYEQYLKEKDACNKYRFVFTIKPYCTNVLFNRITEAVYKEGSSSARLILKENDVPGDVGYKIHKGSVDETNSPITRDTGYSSNSFSGYTDNQVLYYKPHLTYNCGADIFNNHLLRKKEFVCINECKDDDENQKYFNTLFDYVRDPFGETLEGFTYNTEYGTTQLHLYNNDSIYSFKGAIQHNLKEENGWLGFINTSMLRTIKINRIINYKKECTFIDMYPTREHYSFVPYFNEHRKRLEKNWEYCLTYPFENVYDNYAVHENSANGLLCDLDVDFSKVTFRQLVGLDDDASTIIPLRVDFKTHTKHSLQPSDKINLHIITNTNECFTVENAIVVYTGKNGYDNYHYFTLTLSDISTDLRLAYENAGNNENNLHFRFEKIAIDRPCKYYLRKFKKIPNFKNTNILPENGLTEEEINETIQTTNFSSSLNKLGFSKTIYGDDVAQIVYDDDIELTGLRDNLGRELSVIYLTLLKTNYGYKEWYNNNDYANSDVEYSHCFGKLTSGFELPTNAGNNEYNVHRQHNIVAGSTYKNLPETSNKLETEINPKEDFVFYGDLVELDENTIQETILERVQHRFNTAQRETSNTLFSELIIDNITTDDYEGNGWATNTSNNMCTDYAANLAPEGYYYQAHYPIQLKEYSTTVNTGYHTQIADYKILLTENSNKYTIETDKNYYFEVNDTLYLYRKTDNVKIETLITFVGGDDFRVITFTTPNGTGIEDFNLFKPNRIKPEGAYEFNDGTGKYVWRDFVLSSNIVRESDLYDSMFTNGAIYIHKDINFYLKRQDPYGEYGLRPSYDNTTYSYIKIKIPAPEPGTLIRITFDSIISPEGSQCYFEGTYAYDFQTQQASITNVTYHGIGCDCTDGETLEGVSVENIFDIFTLNNVSLCHESGFDNLRLWSYSNGNWQRSSEIGISDYRIYGCIQPGDLEFDGSARDVTYGDYFEPGENNRC